MWPRLGKSIGSSSSKSKLDQRKLLLLASGKQLPMATSPNRSSSPVDVNEEYNRTLRTKSFVDMWSKVHHHLRRTISSIAQSPERKDRDGKAVDEARKPTRRHSTSSTPTAMHPVSSIRYAQLPEFVLEPSQEYLLSVATAIDSECCNNRDVQALLMDYCDTTRQACMACADLLVSIDLTRTHYQSIHLLLSKLSDVGPGFGGNEFEELASHIEQDNPLSQQNLGHFYYVQSCYELLVEQLGRAHRRIVRRLRFIGLAKRTAGITIVGACSIAMAVALLIAVHTVVGIAVVVAAAPVVAAGMPRAKLKWAKAARSSYLKRLGAQVDAAARGAYIVGKDLDTMSRMLRRAHDEVEHERDVTKMVLRSNRERQLVREVAREVDGGAAAMEEQLDELERHVYLCMLTINRSRKMVAQVMMGGASGGAASQPTLVAETLA